MAKYLISFPSATMVVPDGDWEAVGRDSHAVIDEAKAAGVYVFGGGIDEDMPPVRPGTARLSVRPSVLRVAVGCARVRAASLRHFGVCTWTKSRCDPFHRWVYVKRGRGALRTYNIDEPARCHLLVDPDHWPKLY